jgi:hypothetical protein
MPRKASVQVSEVGNFDEACATAREAKFSPIGNRGISGQAMHTGYWSHGTRHATEHVFADGIGGYLIPDKALTGYVLSNPHYAGALASVRPRSVCFHQWGAGFSALIRRDGPP